MNEDDVYDKKYNKYKHKYIELKKNINRPKSTKNVFTNDNLVLIPKISKTNNLFTFDFPDISIASVHYDEGPTGCTYIRFNINDVFFYCDRRGGSVMTMSSDRTRSNKSNIRGICFVGGSILGLEAICGCIVEEWKNHDYKNFGKCDVIGAALRSGNLNYNEVYPDKNLGRFAVRNVIQNQIYLGQAGAGCMAGNGFYGQGADFRIYNGVRIFAFTAVNALGVIYDTTGNIIKNQWESNNNNNNNNNNDDQIYGKNTTLTTLITDLALDFFELEQLSIQCHTNMAIVIRPFNTIGDGDVFFGISLNKINKKNIKKFNIREFYQVCSEVTNNAVINSVKF